MGLLGLVGDGIKGLLGEDSTASLPIVGDLFGAQKDSEKALLAKQKEMAAEMEKRARINEQARMNALGQSILAFNPQNQMLAQMVGPQAAFSPEQFAQMAGNPFPPPGAQQGGGQPQGGQQPPPPSPIDIINGGGGLREIKARAMAAKQQIAQGQQQQAEQQAAAAFQQEEERRRQQILQQMSPLPQGPAPIQMARPAQARRF